MKKIFCFLLLGNISFSFAKAQSAELERLVYTKQFSILNKKLDEPDHARFPQKNIFKALVLNAFSKPAASNKLIAEVLSYNPPMPDSLRFYFLQAQANNYVSLCDYKNAYIKDSLLLIAYPKFFDIEQLEDERQALRIWQVLSKTKPQQLHKEKETRLSLKKDLAGLWNIPVTIGDSLDDFIFDSGAGISTIVETYAKKLGVTMIENSDIIVKSGITGIGNNTKIGVAKELRIGNIVASNVVFLVFPDSALVFAGGAYKIKGIIGFPVIKEFGSITISKNEIFIPLKDSARDIEPNMAIDQLKPVIYFTYNGDVLPFTFDTGANSSTFSDNFYKRYQAEFDKTGIEKEVSLGGAGGKKSFKMLEIPELTLGHYNKTFTLKKAEVSKEEISTNEGFYYGNLGQDIIKKFEKMTINFNQSYILFE